MHRSSLKHNVPAAVLSLLVASLVLVGTAPASAQSKSNGQGIPQQISALEQQVAAISDRLAALSGQLSGLTTGTGTGGGKVLRVVDENGREVGPMISRSEVVLKIDGVWLVLGVGPDGFTESSPSLYNDRFDCQGKPYILDVPSVLKPGFVVDGVAYYASGTSQTVMVGAYQALFTGGGSVCSSFDTLYPQSVSEVATYNLSQLGFGKHFTVRYDQ